MPVAKKADAVVIKIKKLESVYQRLLWSYKNTIKRINEGLDAGFLLGLHVCDLKEVLEDLMKLLPKKTLDDEDWPERRNESASG